jgi:hypothetical protein
MTWHSPIRTSALFSRLAGGRSLAPRLLWQLRLLLLLLSGWWLMAPLSGMLAQALVPALSRTDAVIVASFAGPLLSLCVILFGMWPRRLRFVVVGLAVLHGIAGYWALGVLR